MKLTVFLIILLCLFLLYRIAFAKPTEKQRQDKACPPKPAEEYDAVGKSRFCLPGRCITVQTVTSQKETVPETEKADIFAAGNGKPDAVIPPEKLDEAFNETPGQEDEFDENDLDIPPDEDEEAADEPEDLEEEAEDLRQTLGRDAVPADGLSIEEMTKVADAVENPSDENAGLLIRIEPTDMFEKMVSGDEAKTAGIRAVIDRNIGRLNPEAAGENNEDDGEWNDFNIMNFLG